MSPEDPVLEPVRSGDARPGRRTRLVVGGVLAAALAVVALGWLGRAATPPDTAVVPVTTPLPIGSPVPSPSLLGPGPSPDEPTPTPSPVVAGGMRGDDPDARVVVVTSTAHVVDLSTGHFSQPLAGDGDLLLPLSDGGWLGLWTDVSWTDQEDRRSVLVARTDREGLAGAAILRTTVVGALSATFGPGSAVAASLGLAADERTAALGSVARQPDGHWDVVVQAIPLARGGAAGRAVVGTIPPDDTIQEVRAPRVSPSPDGSSIVVETWIYRQEAVQRIRWIVSSGPDGLSDPRPFGMDDPESLAAYCGQDGWARAAVFVDLCTPGDRTPIGGIARLEIRRTLKDGTILNRLLGPAWSPGWAAAAIAASGWVLTWDPTSQVLAAVDTVTGGERWARPVDGEVPPYDLAAATQALAALRGGAGSLAVAPDGTRAYGIAIGPPAANDPSAIGRALGIRAFDLGSMRLANAWPAPSWLIELEVAPDGRTVYAAGLGSVDTDGRPGRYQPSLAAFDASTGALLALAGPFGDGLTLRQPAPELQTLPLGP